MKTRLSRTAGFALLILLLSVMFPSTGFTQTTTGTILGTVTDQAGAIIPDVTITIRNVETGLTRTTNTDGSGRFRLSSLPPGKYEITAERTGFVTELRSLELNVGQSEVTDFSLGVGNVRETVKVTSETPLVETTGAALQGVVTESQIRGLPLNGRDVFQLTTLQAGVTNTAGITSKSGGGAIDVGPGTTKIAVNGARITANNFLLDGTTANDAYNNTPGAVSGNFTGVDTLREFQILTNSYSAEYGVAGGAVINAVTKSGTNSFHGTGFEFHRNSALDARNFFDQKDVPPFKRNQFGGSVGGPIVTNKTFFFGAYEGLREDLGVSRRFAVPTVATRARAVPSVQPYVNLYPLPNAEDLGNGTAFYVRAGTDRTRDDFFTGRIDHLFSSRDNFFARYTFDQSNFNQTAQVLQDGVTNGRNQYVTLGEDHIFSPQVLNTFRFGFNRSYIDSDFPFIIDIPPELSFIPGHRLGTFFGVSEIAPLGSNFFTPRFFAYNQFEFTDQLSIAKGAHSIKTGFSLRRLQLNAASNQFVDGIYVYFGIPGLSTLDVFLLGLPAAFIAPQPGSDFYRGIRESIIGTFVQDDWKVSRKLTLNLGLRYEAITTPTEVNGKIANLRHVTDPTTTVGAPFFDNPSLKNFAPRVGFAYDPFGDGKSSIRGGYGIFDVNILPFNYRFEISNQPPFANLPTVAGPPPFFFPAPFPNAFQQITSSALPLPPSINSFDFNPKRSYMQQYNLSIQRELLPNLVVTAAYTGSRGVHLARKNDINQRTDFIFLNGRKFFPTIANPESERLNTNFAAIRHIFFDGNSNYNALQLKLDRRFSRGLDFQVYYTWSKAIDDVSSTEGEFGNVPSGSRIQDSLDTRAERGLAAFDIRHNFVASATYALPTKESFTGVKDKLLNGWEITGILNSRSGFPFNVLLGFDRANDASADNVAQRPDVVPGRSYSSAITGNPQRYIDPTAFALPPAGTYGNSARNALIGPGYTVFDLGLIKNTTVKESVRIQFRAEAFNLFNHTNFAIPDNLVVFTSPQADVPGNFGTITRTASTSRQLQFGLKVLF